MVRSIYSHDSPSVSPFIKMKVSEAGHAKYLSLTDLAPGVRSHRKNGHHWLGEVTGVQALLDSGIDRVPEQYVRPKGERPKLSADVQDGHIPVVDLSKLDGPERASVSQEIHQACKEWGFFQMVNHGIPASLMDGMRQLGDDFFAKPLEEKQAFKPRPGLHRSVGLFGSSLNFSKNAVRDWRDALRHRFFAGWESDSGSWPDTGLPLYKETLVAYRNAVTSMADTILRVLAENLGLPSAYFDQALGSRDLVSSVPRAGSCSGNQKPLGWRSLALLQQDAVGGLQALKDGRWISVEPIPYAFVVNVGDTMQALTNDEYPSVAHRVVVNLEKSRLSIITHITPEDNHLLSPAPGLVSPQRGAVYRDYSYREYLQGLFTNGLDGKNALSRFRQVQAS